MDTAFINDIPFFDFLPPGDRPRMAEFLEVSRAGAGEIIYHEGDDATNMGFLIRGRLLVFKDHPEGRQPLNTIEAPNIFGEMALLEGSQRKAGLVAVSESLIAVMDRDRFETLIAEHPRLAVLMLRRLAKLLVERLARMNEKYASAQA